MSALQGGVLNACSMVISIDTMVAVRCVQISGGYELGTAFGKIMELTYAN